MESDSSRRPVVELESVSRQFGATLALDNVSVRVPEGVVFGLVGTNGAGKTTLIKHVMGQLRAVRGRVSIFGLDPARHPAQVLSRIGYLSETGELPEWMRLHELLRFTRAFYPGWDESYVDSLVRTFELNRDNRVNQLSKGQRARLGLVLALAPRPRLLVLDEPSSGLDPLVRRDILRAIIRTIAEEGRTVVFSSHLLDEVERVADHVAIIDGGCIIQNDDLASMKANFHRVVLHFNTPVRDRPFIDGCFNWQGSEHQWSTYFRGPSQELEERIRRCGGEVVDRHSPTLTEIFLALVDSRHSATRGHA
jgi:ABC-2 type transport system ATP-binding protein